MEKEAEFPCRHSPRAVSSRISSREHQNRAGFLILCVCRTPLAWRNSEDLCLCLQLSRDCKPVHGKPRTLSLAPAPWMGGEVSDKKRKIPLSMWVRHGVTNPPRALLPMGLCPSLAPFYLAQNVLHGKLHFILLLSTHGT